MASDDYDYADMLAEEYEDDWSFVGRRHGGGCGGAAKKVQGSALSWRSSRSVRRLIPVADKCAEDDIPPSLKRDLRPHEQKAEEETRCYPAHCLPTSTARRLLETRSRVVENIEARKANAQARLSLAALTTREDMAFQRHISSSPPSSSASRQKLSPRRVHRAAMRPGLPVLPMEFSVPESRKDAERWFEKTDGSSVDDTIRAAKRVPEASFEGKSETCSVCMGDFAEPDPADPVIQLHRCRDHYFHTSCIKQALQMMSRCPCCFTVYGDLAGTQPEGIMTVSLVPNSAVPLAGEGKTDTICIQYNFPSGRQSERHPHPGHPYTGTCRTAYLPNNAKGREVLYLLQRAWDARLIFTVGRSVTTGCDNVVVWAGIHHKTSISGGSSAFGYPDPTYLDRVKEELAAAGIRM